MACRSRNRASRLAATRRRYSAVERMSSIGAISSASSPLRVVERARRPPSAASVRVARTTVGATLPNAIRGGRLVGRRRRRRSTTFEIACAARVPTLRNHCRPAQRAESRSATISSSGRSTRAPVAGVEAVERHAPRAAGASAGRRRHRRRPAPAACRRPAMRSRCCRRACRDSGSARRRPRAHAAASIGSRVRDERRADDVGVRRQRADGQVRSPRTLDRPQRVEPPQIQEPRVLQRAEVERDVQIGAARHRRRAAPRRAASGARRSAIWVRRAIDC